MAKLIQSKDADVNYLAKIVEVKEFIQHPNPKCERLKICLVDGYKTVVSKDTEAGTYVYFPVECQITLSFLAVNNLFRDKELNIDKEATPGFFESKGRVKAVKLQGFPSEGLLMPIKSLYKWLDKLGVSEHISNLETGVEFDSVDGHKLCSKYKVPVKNVHVPGMKSASQPKGLDKIIANQFRFHYDTVLLKKCPYVISPNDIISITEKVHGTSGISSNVICKRNLSWKDKILSLFTHIDDTEYTDLWSSRSVIKNRYINKGVNKGYYGVDVWGIAHEVIKPRLTKGLTVYYEIVGYLPTGGYIQKDYDYGYEVPTVDTIAGKLHNNYTYNKHYGIKVYRVTYTNPDGMVYELSARQVQQWCKANGLDAVTELYYGYAKDLYPDLSLTDHWHENFLERLCNDKAFYMEELSPSCTNKVPHEGVVLKIENNLSAAYKVKCFRFLEKERNLMDTGESDIESQS